MSAALRPWARWAGLLLAGLGLAGVASGQALPGDLDAALGLADGAAPPPVAARDWKASVEAAALSLDHRYPTGEADRAFRLSADLALDTRLAPGWRLLLADRWDGQRHSGSTEPRSVNTLKEAFVSWQPDDAHLLDIGRINLRNGVASGYNPVDYFRADAVRTPTSAVPSNLRENRQGSMMLRAQQLWVGGSLTALYSPRLSQHRSDQATDLNLGATNSAHRWQVALTQSLGERLAPQWLLTGTGSGDLQAGASVSALLSDSLIAFGEWSGGRSRAQTALALGGDTSRHFQARSALGLTWTNAQKMSLTLEYDRNQAAPDRAQWQALGSADRSRYGRWVQAQQELTVREMWWAYLAWQDVGLRQLDLNAFVRLNPYDHSRMMWAEARYHLDRADVALQWQAQAGSAGSNFGALPRQRIVTASLTWYF